MSTSAPPVESLQGNYAGVASRTAAFLIDSGLIVGLYTVTVSAGRFLANLVFGKELLNEGSMVWTIAFGVWSFVYLFYCWGAGGKTPGAALLGIRVVRRDGSHLGFRRAFVRTVVFPFSFLFFGLGLVGVVVGRERRALHDVAAGSTVIYDWDARAARLRFLAKRAA
jgi:uncharacterized RDD family membrane protein YckC